MADFNVRSDSVNVEQIMEQIRARIREKRGVDYTEQQIRELAAVKLEKFLDPRGVRSDLLDQFRKAQPAYEPPELPNFAFEEATLFESHRGPIRGLRQLLLPILKLFFNPNPLIQALNIQARLNTITAERDARRESARRQMDQLYYELIHNLVIETTRLGIDVKNLKMRVESVSSRLEFNERRARALESAVVYKPSEAEAAPVQQAPPPSQQRFAPPQPQGRPYQQTPPRPPAPPPAPPPVAAVAPATNQGSPPDAGGQQGAPGEGPGQRSRRRRRRRGRRGGSSATAMMGAPGAGQPATPEAPASTDATDQMDAMDHMDDDGAPEADASHAAAAEAVDSNPAPASSAVQSTDAAQSPSTGAEPSPTLPEPQGRPEPDRDPTRPAADPSTGARPGGSDTDPQ
jgi:hypothetical protein